MIKSILSKRAQLRQERFYKDRLIVPHQNYEVLGEEETKFMNKKIGFDMRPHWRFLQFPDSLPYIVYIADFDKVNHKVLQEKMPHIFAKVLDKYAITSLKLYPQSESERQQNEIIVLDWQHSCYAYYPKKPNGEYFPYYDEAQEYYVGNPYYEANEYVNYYFPTFYPDGDHYAFFKYDTRSKQSAFGMVGIFDFKSKGKKTTITIFGEHFIKQMRHYDEKLFGFEIVEMVGIIHTKL
ncbi:DUF2716 domain-containing protein [Helicobacter sp. MIT 21-1697]|uniref:DUF2716 domain-containing protein n=1 Tax=Helicobacter sp. MIT 21-1697 TaxID=2993733 RepID=UPI00224ABD15|nr:DUF2716 domain-containing protein [Helicobacter sp. MIT 21-1697]MCX2716166.1 DUF2716 domain-containing protein [Helicobacter sp. MIT 21-1697]